MTPINEITRHLAFKVITPVVLVLTTLGFVLFFMFNTMVRDLIQGNVESDMENLAHDVLAICDQGLEELSRKGHAGNSMAVRIKKALTDQAVKFRLPILLLSWFLRQHPLLSGTLFQLCLQAEQL